MPVSELALRSCKLFSDAPKEVLEQASQQMEIVQLRRREVLTYASKPFRGLGVVLQGRIQAIDQTLDGREVALQTVESSEAFGQVNLYRGVQHAFFGEQNAGAARVGGGGTVI